MGITAGLARFHLVMKHWRLKRTAQCRKCPWIQGANPREIPNGYCEKKHGALRSTIARNDELPTLDAPLQVMACHETVDAHCIGWLSNQLGPGNNIALRIKAMSCDNLHEVRLRGAQHLTFDETLPSPEVASD